jgi:hypothetical protein
LLPDSDDATRAALADAVIRLTPFPNVISGQRIGPGSVVMDYATSFSR